MLLRIDVALSARVAVIFNVVEASIAQLRSALESGEITAVDLVNLYIARIDRYDTPDSETKLNSIVVRNDNALAEAAESDSRRAAGKLRCRHKLGNPFFEFIANTKCRAKLAQHANIPVGT